jgi:hypothetical protein
MFISGSPSSLLLRQFLISVKSELIWLKFESRAGYPEVSTSSRLFSFLRGPRLYCVGRNDPQSFDAPLI